MYALLSWLLLAIILATLVLFLCFTPLEEGKVKYVRRGRMYKKLLFAKKDHAYDEKKDLIVKSPGSIGNTAGSPIVYGYVYTGLPLIDSIYWFPWSWKQFINDPNDASLQVIRVRGEKTNFLFIIPYAYAISSSTAEDKNGQALVYQFEVGLEVVKPRLARFGIANPDDTIQSQLMSIAKNYFGSVEFEDALSEIEKVSGGKGMKVKDLTKNDTFKSEFSQLILSANKKIPSNPKESFISITGHKITYANLINIDFAGKDVDALRQALTANKLAKENGKAALTTAKYSNMVLVNTSKAEASAITNKGTATNKILKERYYIKSKDALAAQVAFSEGIEGSNVEVLAIGEGGKTFLPTIPMTPKKREYTAEQTAEYEKRKAEKAKKKGAAA